MKKGSNFNFLNRKRESCLQFFYIHVFHVIKSILSLNGYKKSLQQIHIKFV